MTDRTPPSSSRSTAAVVRPGDWSTNTAGKAAAHHRRQRRIVTAEAVRDEPVDGCGGDPRRSGASAGAVAGEQQQGGVGGGDGFGDAVEDLQRRRIAEGVREAIGEDDTDRSNPAAPQPRGARIGPGVADLLGEREQAIAQRRRQPLGTIEGVRRGRPRNAGGGREVGQRRPPR